VNKDDVGIAALAYIQGLSGTDRHNLDLDTGLCGEARQQEVEEAVEAVEATTIAACVLLAKKAVETDKIMVATKRNTGASIGFSPSTLAPRRLRSSKF
jgi:hypothetical protein